MPPRGRGGSASEAGRRKRKSLSALQVHPWLPRRWWAYPDTVIREPESGNLWERRISASAPWLPGGAGPEASGAGTAPAIECARETIVNGRRVASGGWWQ